MFLSAPTIDELLTFDLTTLIDMLQNQNTYHADILNKFGSGLQSKACLEMILTIQLAIETKKKLEANKTSTPDMTFLQQDNTSIDPVS